MVIHLIIDPGNDRIIFYANQKETVEKYISSKCLSLDSIDDLFKYINQKMNIGFKNDSLGWALICLDDCIDSTMRKRYLEGCKNCGFKNAKIVDKAVLLLTKVIYFSKEKFEEKDWIWIFDGLKSFVWTKVQNSFVLLFKHDKQIEEGEIEKIKIIYSSSKFYFYQCQKFDVEKVIQEYFATDNTVYSLNTEKLPSLNWEDFIRINITNKIGDCRIQMKLIHRRITLKLNSERIYISGKYLFLPHQQLLNLKCNNNRNESVLELIEYDKVIQKQTFKSCDEVTLNIDENGICSFKLMDKESGSEVQVSSIKTDHPPFNSGNSNTLQKTKKKVPLPPPKSPNFIPADPYSTRSPSPSKTKVYQIPPRIESFQKGINAIGIDLGTSRCCVAVRKVHQIETVGIENNGDRLMPSYVSFTNPKQSYCGQIVVDNLKKLQNASKSTIFDSKRILGKDFEYLVPDPAWPFELANMNGKAGFLVQCENGPFLKTPEEISAILLKHIKTKVEEFQGETLSKAVITIPAAFTDSQKVATLEAAKIAEWNPRFLPEPVAAAFGYFDNHDFEFEQNSTMLVFDLGGGTLDICLFRVAINQIEIIKEAGDSFLGGRDFDNLLFNYFNDRLERDFEVFVRNDQKKKYKLLAECQKIKENLSVKDREEDRLDVDTFLPDNGNTILITRETFEVMAKPLLYKIQTFIATVLQESGFQSNQISKILLVGGGSRMPMIKEMLTKKFPAAIQCREEHPEEVVAKGAAMYAYFLMTRKNNSEIS